MTDSLYFANRRRAIPHPGPAHDAPFEQERIQPIQKAPAVIVDNEGLLICARMDAIEDGPGYLPPLAQRVPSSPRGTVAIPPPGLGAELYVPRHARVDLHFRNLPPFAVRPAPRRYEAAACQRTETQTLAVLSR